MNENIVSKQLQSALKKFDKYLARNPSSEIVELTLESGGKRRVILRPWGDESIAIVIPNKSDALASALNCLHLPARFTATYHCDTRQLEVIWTAFKLDEDQQKIIGRSFELRSAGKKYHCAFKESSGRLLEIAKYAIPLQMSETEFRNLRSFNTYVQRESAKDESILSIDRPISFWIGKTSWNEEEIFKLVNKINFYMKQFDYASPTVKIHPPKNEMNINPRTRFLWDEFPSIINSSNLNENLITLWSAAFSAPTETEKFLNFYRIIEYVSYFHVEKETLAKLRSELIRPNLLDDLNRSMDSKIGIVQEYKGHKTSERILGVLREAVDPKII